MTQYQAMSGDLGPFATSYYDCEFDRENSTYYPGEEVTGKFYLRRFARVPQGKHKPLAVICAWLFSTKQLQSCMVALDFQ